MSNSEKILLICQDPLTQIFIKSSVETHPDWTAHPIDTVTNLEKALQEITEKNYLLILLDCQSFGASPLEALIQIRSVAKKSPLILINRPGMERTAINCLKSGADYYLTKEPNWEEELPTVMETVLEESLHRQNTTRKIHMLESENEKLKESSILDEDTAFYSAEHFNFMLSRELRRANRYGLELACLIMDIGKNKGEDPTLDSLQRVYTNMGLLLRSVVRSSDIWARIDQHRFAALLPHTSKPQAHDALRRLVGELSEMEKRIHKQGMSVRIKWGLASFDKEKIQDEHQLLEEAISALQ